MEFLFELNPLMIVQVALWFLAGVISFYFSIGNARIWTSISLGFFLIFLSQAYLLNPLSMYHKLAAIHYIIGTIAIMVLTHGFQEYYVFSRTLEVEGSKAQVYLVTMGVIAASAVFVYLNPKPSDTVLRNIKMIENANWVFLSLVNLDMIRKIYLQIRDSAMAKGFIAFSVVFLFIFLWKGSELYLQIYLWDKEWIEIMDFFGVPVDAAKYPARVNFSLLVSQSCGFISSLSVGGTFLYLFRLLR